ncbi:BatD family protein [Idiomarina seosinensis]|uniref:BatD family protein n=1 Tax=Idiomarina seosinensis TaxID=281739 RepID=UPI00384CFFE3
MVRISAILLVLVSLFITLSAQADVTRIEASVDKNPVIANESFVLSVTFNDDVGNDAFQPQQLLQDFIVGRTSVSRQTSIVNGSLNKLTRFSTVLIAEQPGTYRIPPISKNGVSSEAIEIKVLEAGSDNSARSEKVAFIETSVDNQSVFLQQPLTYIVRLYLAADLNKGNLLPPEMEQADIRQIGSDQETSEMVDGRRYKVYQRTFQITPNKSGTFSISGARFNGEVYAEGQRSIFSSFSNTQPVSTRAKDIQLTVKPIPSNWRGDWLPSELVTLSQTVSPEKASVNVGEPISLTYQLTAVGVKPEQLPPIEPQFPDSVRVYPDDDQVDQFVRNGVSIAQKTVTYAVVPNQPGELTLPALQIPWFNTKRKQPETASTEALTLDVTGVASPLTDAETSSEPTATAEPTSAGQSSDSEAEPTAPQTTVKQLAGQNLITLLVVLLVLSLIGNLAVFWRRHLRKRQQTAPAAVSQPGQALTQSQQWRNFQKACADNQARKAEAFLRQWAKQEYGQPLVSLNQLALWLQHGDKTNSQLQQQLNDLQRSLFSAGKPDWSGGKALYQSLRKALKAQQDKASEDQLPNLYRR